MSGRYEAHLDPNDRRRVIVVDTVGSNHAVSVWTDEQCDALYRHISDLFDAGVARFGSVDRFAVALELAVAR